MPVCILHRSTLKTDPILLKADVMEEKLHQLKLEQEATYVLEEARMVIPGIQALFGFQLIAVFNSTFDDKLGSFHKILHFGAILLTVIAMTFLMGPATYHRSAEPRQVSRRFATLAGYFVEIGMFFLSVSISLDVFLVGQIILEQMTISITIAIAVFFLFSFLWFVFPHWQKRRLPYNE